MDRDAIDRAYVVTEMTADGWTLEQTGGGCEAFTLDLEEGTEANGYPYLMLTTDGDPSIPTATEPVVVGMYVPEVSEALAMFSYPTFRDALASVRGDAADYLADDFGGRN